jgi:hypothetical protein
MVPSRAIVCSYHVSPLEISLLPFSGIQDGTTTLLGPLGGQQAGNFQLLFPRVLL